MVEWENELSKYRRVLDLRDKAREQGHEYKLPPPVLRLFADEPDVDDGDLFFLTAYKSLATCRPEGFTGDRPIPWWCIEMYIERYGIDEDIDLLHTFRHVINALDAADRRWHRANPPPKKDDKTPPGNTPRGRR